MNGMEIGVKREDPMSQESQGESPSSSILTPCTINQCSVGQIPSIFDGELHNFDVLNEDDDGINLFVENYEMDQDISDCNSKNECFIEICDETLKKNQDENDRSFLVDDENDVVDAFVNSLTLGEDFCVAHDAEMQTNQNDVFLDEISKHEQQSLVCVKQPIGMLNECLLEAMLCDGICVFIHTISAYIKHDGACMLIHARKGDDDLFFSKLVLIFVHDDAKILWLFLIVSLGGDHVYQMWWFEVQIASKNGVYFCTNNMELMFLDDNVLAKSMSLQIEAKAHNLFEEVFVKAKDFLLKNFDPCLQNNETYFEVIGSKVESTQWSGDFLITLWFYKFVLYELSWMLIYLMGSKPWHVANKWCTCNYSLCGSDTLYLACNL
ncbi:hypothetical protein L7F22_060325 [Adiantum nelumboides]|nr:hypothetical protein [Adiantum nelumboides]